MWQAYPKGHQNVTVLLVPSHRIERNLKYVKSKKVIFDIMVYKLKWFRQKGYFLKECEGKAGVAYEDYIWLCKGFHKRPEP